MKLSVLIPMFNAEEYIGNCLDSLLNQGISSNEYEILVMDDGSTDTSANIVDIYAKKHKNIFLFKESNSGESSTRNKLAKKAKGTYIYNFDADDYLVNHTLNTVLEKAIDKDLELLGFDTLLTNTTSDVFNNEIQIKNSDFVTCTGKDFIKKYRDMRHEVWWYIVKKSFLKETKIKFAEHKFNADLVYTMDLFLRAHNVGYYPVAIHRYVQTPESVVRSVDIDKRTAYFDNLYIMMVNYNNLIDSAIANKKIKDDTLIDNLKYRLDKNIFFSTIKLIRTGFPNEYLKHKIAVLKHANAYPIKHFIGKEYNSLFYKMLNSTFNNEKVLYTIVWFYSIFGLRKRNSN
ncbi:glycosyltransferase [Hyunsoonleella pacifica]|uniref:Glycosyltransferase n=1 Tax=Hyunsoonleella pacifica TaxID=1080224 RepID=A0A4Q9FU09_9FLAO|nr:glycosyltransferase [Hyunsoonleella pacifica]TBN17619.1 glycosyltransferase [Hyunsoonleella pacifica]GGD10381.1 hypothetical protein GCM10011368_10450 [Hyunsoonleella pacifica]